ncbi:NAD(P)-dependent oxidoreductase [Enterococcus lemanii]|uniref:NAD(P)-dependent oxidoreductase n=1 Tax=Enterococcus lemanii TaxID=1159752 RepID=A0ABV9MYM3_9ENTE|nr:NAD(P)-dependent oxidoreductase [Enterococcus lemanii]MBM7710204.1 phosphoglycerate dehydrogenase-like enzyme [Enterococcus lemanii]
MTKKIIYYEHDLKPIYLAELQQMAPDYQFRSKHTLTQPDYQKVAVMLGWNKQFGPEILATPNHSLKWIQANSAGVDAFDFTQLAQNQVTLTNVSGIHASAITETVIGFLLARYRGLQTSIRAQSQNQWVRHTEIAYDELAGKKMLIFGTGQIGQQLAHVITHLGVDVYGVNRSGRQLTPFKQVFAQTNSMEQLANFDIIVNILPLTRDTKHFYNAAFFAQTKPGASFINVGRGPSVQTADLVTALKSGQIGFAGLDVFEEEPLPSEHPLWALENVLITPHIAGLIRHFQKHIMTIYRENLTSFLATGQPKKNIVDLTSGY